MSNYLDENEIRKLIKKHNQFIDFPIYLQTIKTRPVESAETTVIDADADEGENKAVDSKPTTENYTEWEFVNQEKPIWTRNPKEVTVDEYASFYKTISGDYEQHLDVSHFSVEGQIEFKGLLFVPKRAPFDMFENSGNKKPNNIKLYVRKVFITDNCEDIIPDYMKFVKGVIDSEDLPLNISRETLQQNKIMKVIKKNVMKKCMDLFNTIAEDADKYKIFYEQYNKNIKLGIHEDSTNRQKLASFLRFESSKSGDGTISLDEYINNMKEGQKGIYYITGESKRSVNNSPFLEKLRKRDIEVLFLTDPLDEYITQQLKEYNERKLICITKENMMLDDDKEEAESFEVVKKNYEKTCEYIKNILGDNIEKVVVSNRLDTSPCVLVTNEYGWTANMQRIMKAQALRSNDGGMGHMMNKKIMEINPYNNIIKRINDKVNGGNIDVEQKTLNDLIYLLYDITMQSSGFTLDDPASFSNRILKLINIGLGVEEEDVIEDDAVDGEKQEEQYAESTMEEVD
jgi:molecular chaperone HtpG